MQWTKNLSNEFHLTRYVTFFDLCNWANALHCGGNDDTEATFENLLSGRVLGDNRLQS